MWPGAGHGQRGGAFLLWLVCHAQVLAPGATEPGALQPVSQVVQGRLVRGDHERLDPIRHSCVALSDSSVAGGVAGAGMEQGFSVKLADGVLRVEPVLFAIPRGAGRSPPGRWTRPQTLREGLVQAHEIRVSQGVGDGDRENTEDGSGGDDQWQLAA